MLDGFAGDHRQAGGKRVGFLATVRLDITDDHVAPGGELASRGLEHGVGLVAAVHEFILTNPAPDSASKRSGSGLSRLREC